jgi:protein-disulfide isomerase
MNAKDLLNNVLVATAVLCAVVSTGLLVRREFFMDRPAASQGPVRLQNSQKYAVGHHFGAPDAAVKIVEFSDFQCSFCKRFVDSTWSIVRKRFPNDVALIYRHWPLTTHKHAYAAARASECAAQQEKFAAFHDVLFQKQDSIGTKPYPEFAVEAGVPDTAAFNACNARTEKVPAIERDIAAARELQARGTPAILVNDKRFPANPTTEQLVSLIEEELKEKRKR